MEIAFPIFHEYIVWTISKGLEQRPLFPRQTQGSMEIYVAWYA